MAATRNYARHLRVITVLQTKSRQLRNLITLTKCAIILREISNLGHFGGQGGGQASI
eukprot:SAG25_NODE_10088_length_346_cov_0.777328_1_plen_56_part_01